MRIAVAGSGGLAMHMIAALAESTHEIAALVDNGRKCRGMRRGLESNFGSLLRGEASIPAKARALGVPLVWLDTHEDDELAPLRDAAPDILLVGGFSIILKRPLLELPPLGCVNAHPSLLPKHRGPNPFRAVVLHGETESGVTFHVMEERIDTGGILDQTAFPLHPRDTPMAVYRKACALAGERAVPVMDRIASKGIQAQPQREDLATYDKRITEADSEIDWRQPAEAIERFVRALVPSPMPYFRHRGRKIIVSSVHAHPAPVDAPPGEIIAVHPRIRVATGKGTLLLTAAYFKSRALWLRPFHGAHAAVGERLQSVEQEP